MQTIHEIYVMLPEILVVSEKVEFSLYGFIKGNSVIDVTLTTTSHNNIALAKRNDFALDNVQNIDLCSSVNKVWFCENCYSMYLNNKQKKRDKGYYMQRS